MSHTPEPWYYRNGDDWISVGTGDKEESLIADMLGEERAASCKEANARRIVACVNACQGVKFTGDPTDSVRRLIEVAQAANFAAQVNPKLWAMHEALEAALAAFTLEEQQQ